jgi:hypothetical protein
LTGLKVDKTQYLMPACDLEQKLAKLE